VAGTWTLPNKGTRNDGGIRVRERHLALRNEGRDMIKGVEAHREVGETVKTWGKSGTGGPFPDSCYLILTQHESLLAPTPPTRTSPLNLWFPPCPLDNILTTRLRWMVKLHWHLQGKLYGLMFSSWVIHTGGFVHPLLVMCDQGQWIPQFLCGLERGFVSI